MEQHKFHVPLSEDVYQALHEASKAAKQPATVLAREAIETWLRQHERAERSRAIAEYAEAASGSEQDLDESLETATLESWHTLP